MHPSIHARHASEKPAIVMAASGRTLSYGELDARSNQGARLFRREGLGHGDVIAMLIENRPEYFELAWAAQRAGLYYVCISTQLTPAEVEYIVKDSGAKLLIISPDQRIAAALPALLPDVSLFALGKGGEGYRSWDDEADAELASQVPDERGGTDMLYSSGTTGRPKGIKPPLPDDPSIAAPTSLTDVADRLGFGSESVYLTPAPLYHAAPLRWSMLVHRLGGTVVVMEKFDAEAALRAIERHRVTHSQWVPTHFIRILKLPADVRARFDLSSLRLAIHAAAPCPVPVKQAMIDWWGPILLEYYAGTESNGMTMISSAEWLARPGSVGRAVVGALRICNEAGELLPPREEGTVYFEGGSRFAYHNDSAKTEEATNAHGWTTIGDVGWVDEDGYLYLTDRKSFMIISGGVNIYPQEIENLLAVHPKVSDVAVIGAPHSEMGEAVVAVVQPQDQTDATPAFAAELTEWLRPQLSGVKMPRRIDFTKELPRHPTGKLYKRLIRDKYWGNS